MPSTFNLVVEPRAQRIVGAGSFPADRVAEKAAAGFAPPFSSGEWRRVVAHYGLTPREEQVARLVCSGFSQREIAGCVGLSVNTVRMHLRSLFRRLDAHDRVTVLVRLLLAARALGDEAGLAR